jgi:hypothetical protein
VKRCISVTHLLLYTVKPTLNISFWNSRVEYRIDENFTLRYFTAETSDVHRHACAFDGTLAIV